MSDRVDLKVGFRCNNFCHFCVQGEKRGSLPAKDMAQLRQELEAGRKKGRTSLVLTGGEPTLHPKFLDVVACARELGYDDIQVQTNGRLFCYEPFVRKLLAAGVTEFSPSLHGSRPEIHDFLTGSPGSFLQTVSGIRNVKKLGARVITNSVVTKPNYRDLPELARLLVSLGVDQYQFAFIHIGGRAAQNKDWIVPRKALIEPWVKRGLDVGRAAGVRVMTEAIPYCRLRGYEDCIAENIMPETMIFDADSVTESYAAYRHNEGKAKRAECRRCRYDRVCEGPWKEYPEIFGWEEFEPIAA